MQTCCQLLGSALVGHLRYVAGDHISIAAVPMVGCCCADRSNTMLSTCFRQRENRHFFGESVPTTSCNSRCSTKTRPMGKCTISIHIIINHYHFYLHGEAVTSTAHPAAPRDHNLRFSALPILGCAARELGYNHRYKAEVAYNPHNHA